MSCVQGKIPICPNCRRPMSNDELGWFCKHCEHSEEIAKESEPPEENTNYPKYRKENGIWLELVTVYDEDGNPEPSYDPVYCPRCNEAYNKGMKDSPYCTCEKYGDGK